jgi:hypothetical protein
MVIITIFKLFEHSQDPHKHSRVSNLLDDSFPIGDTVLSAEGPFKGSDKGFLTFMLIHPNLVSKMKSLPQNSFSMFTTHRKNSIKIEFQVSNI